MTPMKTLNGAESGKVYTDQTGLQSQTILNSDYIIHTYLIPDIRTENSWRQKTVNKIIMTGDFVYDNDGRLTSKSIESLGSFGYGTQKDGSIQETGYSYYFNEPLKDENVFADDYASSVGFRYDTDPPNPLPEENPNIDKTSAIYPTKLYSTPITKTRKLLEKSEFSQFIPKEWGEEPFKVINNNSDPITDERNNEEDLIIKSPSKFNKKSADKITNFNPSTDTLEIDTDSFGIDSSATFASGKNKKTVKKKLAKQDFDFLYDENKGGLYFNENGADKGFGEGGIIAILKGAPDLTSDNLEFI